jgi:phosphoribosyl 1,2-cyclic phosphate phosphodiesterase
MKVTFLGTGTSQGIPIIACECEVCSSNDSKDKRLRTSILIESEKTSIVVDTGPDFRQQMLREQVKKLDAVVFTHDHKDHTAGFDDIRGFNWASKQPMEVFANHQVEVTLKRDFHYAFAAKKYPGVPNLNLHIIDLQPFSVGKLTLTPIQVMHHKLPVYGYRVGDFTYITDANYISEEEKEKIRGTKVLVLNALRKTDHISHFSLEQAIALSQEVGAERTYFTHLSHQMGFHAEVNSQLPKGMEIAYDGLKVEA